MCYGPGVFGLYIREATGKDQGIYSFEAKNVAGKATTAAYIHVDTYKSPYTPKKRNFTERCISEV